MAPVTERFRRKNADPERGIALFGFWASLGTALLALVTFGIAVCTPPISGPFCAVHCVDYPYLDVGPRFPRDYFWMFPALFLELFFVAFMAALHARAAGARRLFTQVALQFAVLSAGFILGAYYLQIAVIQPSLLAGEADGIALLSQYNPHGVFIALEELGYILMSASLLIAAPALTGEDPFEKWARATFVGGGAACAAGVLAVSLRLGHARQYILEIAVITIAWLTLIPGASLMAAKFRRDATP